MILITVYYIPGIVNAVSVSKKIRISEEIPINEIESDTIILDDFTGYNLIRIFFYNTKQGFIIGR